MSEHDGAWADGTPCWVDLLTGDIDGAMAFYGELFGWEFGAGSPEFGGYRMATRRDRPVAGLAPPPPGWSGPTVWQTYLATSDADATATRVTEHGGTLIFPVMDVADVGRMSAALDPTGSAVSFWQAGTLGGFALADEPGTDVWNELLATDYAAALAFYGAVFPVTFTALGDDGLEYSMMRVDGREVGGLGAADPGGHTGWRTYFAVDSTDATVATARRLGGTVVQPAQNTPFGRMAHLRDSGGADFSIIEVAGPATT